jgi:phosphoglycolate phosphatase
VTNPAALFDLDGTLTESGPGIIASVRHAAATLGHTIDPAEDLSWVIGPPLETFMRRVLERFGDTRLSEAVDAYRAHYGTVGLFDSRVYPGIEAALAGFCADGWQMFVATSKREDFARRILEHCGLADRFRAIYGSDGAGALAQKPELIRHILHREALRPAATVMIGDRSYDIDGARANGVKGIGVAWGYSRNGELRRAGADAIAASPAELLAVATTQLHNGRSA